MTISSGAILQTPVVSDIVVVSAFVVMFGSALAEPPKIGLATDFRVS